VRLFRCIPLVPFLAILLFCGNAALHAQTIRVLTMPHVNSRIASNPTQCAAVPATPSISFPDTPQTDATVECVAVSLAANQVVSSVVITDDATHAVPSAQYKVEDPDCLKAANARTCTINIGFSPLAVGAENATMVISVKTAAAAPAALATVALNANGIAAPTPCPTPTAYFLPLYRGMFPSSTHVPLAKVKQLYKDFPDSNKPPGNLWDEHRNAVINCYYSTTGTVSYFNQFQSIYNAASGSATISADIASLNFPDGTQWTLGSNIQAGSGGTPAATVTVNAPVPTLPAASAAQAVQNMLYGGTVYLEAVYPLYFYNNSSPGGQVATLALKAREGLDVQNFNGASTAGALPPTHFNFQAEGYWQILSINPSTVSGTTNASAGAFFLGGSYGYSYTSHGYAREYGFGKNVNNGIGQVSAGMLVTGVVKIAVSRSFGPSQTYIDSTTTNQTTVNNFKSWSFGIAYQSPPPAAK